MKLKSENDFQTEWVDETTLFNPMECLAIKSPKHHSLGWQDKGLAVMLKNIFYQITFAWLYFCKGEPLKQHRLDMHI